MEIARDYFNFLVCECHEEHLRRHEKGKEIEMRTIQKPNVAAVFGVLLVTTFVVRADNTTLQLKLESEYARTSINAEGGVVTQGVTLSLKKDGLTAGATSTCASDYSMGGKFALTGLSKATCNSVSRAVGFACKFIPGGCPILNSDPTQATRRFVRGEKFYVTQIQVADGIAFSLISDAVDNVTYKAEIRFKTQDPAQVDRMMAEVFGVTRPDNQQQSEQKVAPAASTPMPPPSQSAAFQPPPPPDAVPAASVTVSLGQSIDQVVGLLGQPGQILDAGSKKIYLFSNLKVTFVDGKVTDAQ
jgi:hypothetical protein